MINSNMVNMGGVAVRTITESEAKQMGALGYVDFTPHDVEFIKWVNTTVIQLTGNGR